MSTKNFAYIIEKFEPDRSNDWDNCWVTKCVFSDLETANNFKSLSITNGIVVNIIKVPLYISSKIK